MYVYDECLTTMLTLLVVVSMWFLGAVLHVMYVNVITPATVVCVVLINTLLHSMVVSLHSGFMDNGLLGVVVLILGFLMWLKENNVDYANGVHDVSAAAALGVSVALVVVSEAALFGAVL